MKWFTILLAMLSIALVGCKGGGFGGTYKVDTSTIPNFDKAPEAAKANLEKMRVTFNSDKTTDSDDGTGKKEKGTWDLKDKTLTVTSPKNSQTGTVGDDGSITFSTQGQTIKLIKA